MDGELVKRLREVSCGAKDTLWWQAADAIEELQKAVNFHKFNSEFWKDKYNSLADEKWIPVTERLPDKPGIYAVWTAKGFGNHLSTSCFDGDSWSLRITHWMPLPEPPKEETE